MQSQVVEQRTSGSQYLKYLLSFSLRKHLLSPSLDQGFPGGSAGKESACNAGDLGSIPGLGRSPGEGNGYPLQYSGLENPMDGGAFGPLAGYRPWGCRVGHH